ncbi:ubiquitin-like-specific protease 1A [Phragmites australis]|uniref:ubiquitin-like-specific protease 1A n=1 Tax=Phragmites australis TaxID=29695 RepID=UPI002D777289|nr:ubiquitin-like-specific protease 1A [Phragmites australis]
MRIFLPMYLYHHWLLVVVNAENRQVQGFERYMKHLPDEDRNDYKWWKDLDVTSWDINTLQGLPHQEDSTSCGLFVLKFMEHWNGNRLQKDFNQELIDRFRRKLAAILVKSTLNEVKIKFLGNGSPLS